MFILRSRVSLPSLIHTAAFHEAACYLLTKLAAPLQLPAPDNDVSVKPAPFTPATRLNPEPE